jgi:hypothetical protein
MSFAHDASIPPGVPDEAIHTITGDFSAAWMGSLAQDRKKKWKIINQMEDMVIEFKELEILEVGGAVLIPYR